MGDAPTPQGGESGGWRDRRRFIRVQTHVGVTCQSDDDARSAVVTDISLGGLRLETRTSFASGQEVRIAPAVRTPGCPSEAVRGRVVWTVRDAASGREVAGVALLDEPHRVRASWVGYVLGSETTDDQRRAWRRVPADIPARGVVGPRSIPGRIVDLSPGGAGFESGQVLPTGIILQLFVGPHASLPVMEVPARVINARRVDGAEVFVHGLMFRGLGQAEDVLMRYLRVLEGQPDDSWAGLRPVLEPDESGE